MHSVAIYCCNYAKTYLAQSSYLVFWFISTFYTLFTGHESDVSKQDIFFDQWRMIFPLSKSLGFLNKMHLKNTISNRISNKKGRLTYIPDILKFDWPGEFLLNIQLFFNIPVIKPLINVLRQLLNGLSKFLVGWVIKKTLLRL